MNAIQILGLGHYSPGKAISNQELKENYHLEFEAEKFEQKTGIQKRYNAHLSQIFESTADFAQKALERALQKASLNPHQIDCFIVGTDTPEYISPATALLIQGRLQKEEKKVMAFDINASCASFTTALDLASSLLESHPEWSYIALMGVYHMTSFIRGEDVFGKALFSDGAGALLLGRTPYGQKSSYLSSTFRVDGTQWNYIGVYAGGAAKPICEKTLATKEYGLQLLQRLPPERNVRLWPMMVQELLQKVCWNLEEVDHFVFTQINKKTILEVMEVLRVDPSYAVTIMEERGYTGSACIPMALSLLEEEGKLQRGQKVISVASGAGFAVVANAWIY